MKIVRTTARSKARRSIGEITTASLRLDYIEERLKVEVKKLLSDISKMKSVEIEISEKERDSIYETEYEEMIVMLQSILNVIGNVDQLPMNKIAKHMIMKVEYKPDLRD